MFCLRGCWDKSSQEPHKNGAFQAWSSPSSGRTTRKHHNTSTTSKNDAPIGCRHRYIPWIWSRQFQETYQLGPVLGKGSYAIVHEAVKINNPHPSLREQQQSFAVKILPRARLNSTDLRHLRSELLILLDLRHDHIIRLHELYKTPHYFFVVTEKLNGGELFDRICEKEFYSEMEARDVCRTVFEAVAYCHSNRIAHRDLKPENLLLISPDLNDSRVKIADFGFACRVPRPQSLTTILGSPAFTAPEIINYKAYDERVDNWSLGVIVYTILGGYSPFHEDTVRATYQQIRTCNYKFDPEYWDGISRDAKHLIRGLLTIDVHKRTTAEGALSHAWMIGRGEGLRNNAVNVRQMKRLQEEERKKKSKTVRSASMYWLYIRR